MVHAIGFAILLGIFGALATALPRAVASRPGPDSTRTAVAPPESLCIALLETGPAFRVGLPPSEQPGFAGHAAHMRSLTAAGTLVVGGPFGDDPEHMVLSGAMLVLSVASLEDAHRVVAADPGIASGLLRVKLVSRWVPASGVLARAMSGSTEAR